MGYPTIRFRNAWCFLTLRSANWVRPRHPEMLRPSQLTMGASPSLGGVGPLQLVFPSGPDPGMVRIGTSSQVPSSSFRSVSEEEEELGEAELGRHIAQGGHYAHAAWTNWDNPAGGSGSSVYFLRLEQISTRSTVRCRIREGCLVCAVQSLSQS